MKEAGKRTWGKKIRDYVLAHLYAVYSFLIPKKKNYLVFRPFHDRKRLSGNIKALILYAHEHHKDLRPTLVTTNKRLQKEAKRYGLRTKSSYLCVFWAVLRAEHIVMDSYSMIFRLGKFSIIQLWHGVGFKNIGLMNEGINKSPRRRKILKTMYSKFDLIASTSVSDQGKQNKSFGVNTAKITGYPRNDMFFASNGRFEDLKKQHGFDKYNQIITYAPTFRDYKTGRPFSEQFWWELQQYLTRINGLFVVKKHPWDIFLKVPDKYDNIKDVSSDFQDAQELLMISDFLITDYSSVATDFVLTGKPILIYAYDLDQYKKNCRSIYYNLEAVLPRPFLEFEEELLEKLKDKNWCNDPAIKRSYIHFRNTFHQHLDGNSSKRVMQAILEL